MAPAVRDRVRLHGRLSDADRGAVLRAADVFAAPALEGESFGIAVAEAVATGLPAVVTEVGGVPELVRPDAGLVVPPGDAAGLAAALARYLGRPAGRVRGPTPARPAGPPRAGYITVPAQAGLHGVLGRSWGTPSTVTSVRSS